MQAEQARELLLQAPQRTMPQVFIDGEAIGGFTELNQLVKFRAPNPSALPVFEPFRKCILPTRKIVFLRFTVHL